DSFAERPECVVGGCAQTLEFGCELRNRMLREERRQASLDPVDRGDEEVAGSHRKIDAAEVEEGLCRLRLFAGIKQRAEPCDVVVECRLERVIQEVFDGKRLGEVAAARLA